MSRDTIFIPRLVLVVAGMNNVVRLFGAGIAIRWFALQHPVVSCVPVEYSWRASARLSCNSRMSSRLKESNRERTSESERTVRGILWNMCEGPLLPFQDVGYLIHSIRNGMRLGWTVMGLERKGNDAISQSFSHAT